MFRKFNSLENHYNITKDYFNLKEIVVVSEKIDGSNFSIVIEEDGSYRYASRNQLVDTDWNGVDALVDKKALKDFIAMHKGKEVNIYGEVFSSKILRRIPYGDTKLRFYTYSVEGEHVPQLTALQSLAEVGFETTVYTTMTLEQALDIDIETFYTAYAKDSIAEGVVIMPAERPRFSERVFGIKYKSSAFLEKSKEKKKPKELSPYNEQFSQFINENRVLSYISKNGEITDKKQIGDYVKGIIEDAWEDFIAEFDADFHLGTEKKSVVGGSGSVIAQMLLKRLVSVC